MPSSVMDIKSFCSSGALDDTEDLTSLERHLCSLPLDPNIGKILLMGPVFQCLDPGLRIVGALAYRYPFVLPIDRKEEPDAIKRSFAGDSCRFRSFYYPLSICSTSM